MGMASNRKKKKSAGGGGSENTLNEKETRQPSFYSGIAGGTHMWQVLLIVFLSIGVYANTLSNEFVWDDSYQIRDNNAIKSLSNIPSLFTTSVAAKEYEIGVYYRPVFNTTLAVIYAVWKLHPTGYHIANILLHALTSLLVFIASKKLLRSDAVSLIAAVIFAVHPAHVEAVAWISALGHPLGAVFMLLSLVSYITFREDGQKRYLFLALACSFSAVLSIEMAATLPGIILLYEILLTKKASLGSVALFVASVGLYFTIRNTVLSSFDLDVNTLPLFSRLLTAPVMTIKYFFAFLFPFVLKVGYDIKPIESALNLSFLAAVIMLAGIIWVARRNLVKDSIISFGVLWFFVTLFPALSIVKQVHPMPMSLRYLYIPSIGLSLSAAAIIHQLVQKFHIKYATFGMAVAVAFLSYGTFYENKKWSNEITLFQHMTDDNPESAYAHYALGNAYLGLQRYKDASAEYNRSLELKTEWQIHPNLWDVYKNISISYRDQGLLEEAVIPAKTALALQPGNPDLHNNLGAIYSAQGLAREASNEYGEALKIWPSSPEAHHNLGILYAEQGRLAEAASEYLEAVKGRPSYPEAHYNLGRIYAEQGKYDEAINEYREAVNGKPSYPEAHYNLGNLFIKKNNLTGAIREYAAAVGQRPDYDIARHNLALAYFINGDRDSAMKEYEILKRGNPELADKLLRVFSGGKRTD